MKAMKKTGEQPDARDLWFTKCMAARRLEEVKNRTDEDRRRDEVIRKEGEMMAKRIQVAEEKENSGVAYETQVGINRNLFEVGGQEATRRPDCSDLPLGQDGRPARTEEGRHKLTDQRGESMRSHGEYLQSDDDAEHKAPSSYERFSGLDGDHCELENIPDDPEDASFDDLQALHVRKDQLYKAQEDYYCALRLQILARYQRMHMRYLREVRAMRTRKNDDVQDVGVPARGNGWPNERKSAKPRCRKRRRTSSRHLQPQKVVDETFEQNQSEIEDRISFYNFGYEPEDEHLTREEEIQLLPLDIDIAEIHAKRYELRDRFPGGYENSETSLIASGRAFYAARRLKLWKMRQVTTTESAQVEAESQ
ncbi:uncharacterized protein J4E87_008878 [Alternaria ethzedia]|uniref:uncharacterized protein n=1 Tax=Alternaria ethzedia TaxID=181014 RepID=UPI0020C20BE5|nr:uncharacterized protein J4E87_008878 [Alternaria ethzedia]KAI4616143.1 hypothetical protein J4E87_008878 [Alternaria ethzedia]